MIILLWAILGFHEWRVENLVSTSRSVFNLSAQMHCPHARLNSKARQRVAGRGTLALGASDSKDPTQDHFFPFMDSYHAHPPPKRLGGRCARLFSSPRKRSPAPLAPS